MDQFHRRLRDICADCYNYWQKWQELNNESISIAQSLANHRILLLDPKASSDADPDFDADAVQAQISETIDKKIAPILVKFEHIASKFRKFDSDIDSLKKLCDLNCEDFKADGVNLDRLCKLVKILKETCHQELICKRTAFADLPTATSRNATVLCVSCFVHQPFVDDAEITFLLEGCVLEYGHKTA